MQLTRRTVLRGGTAAIGAAVTTTAAGAAESARHDEAALLAAFRRAAPQARADLVHIAKRLAAVPDYGSSTWPVARATPSVARVTRPTRLRRLI